VPSRCTEQAIVGHEGVVDVDQPGLGAADAFLAQLVRGSKPALGSSTMNRLIASVVSSGRVRAATSRKSAKGALLM
jgi:hypothetical protein